MLMPLTRADLFLSLQKSFHFLSLKNSLFFLSLPKLLSTHRNASTLPLSMSASAMESGSSCVLVLCGKSSTESEIAKTLKENNVLKLPENTEISVLLHSETERLPVGKTSFTIDSYLNSLTTKRFGRFLIWSPLLTSTQDVVSHNFCELPIGTVCIADVQYKGRGRGKNLWESPLGCLLFSFTIQMEDGRVVPLVQYVVSLALTEAIKDICNKNGIPPLDIRIKWPNDVYLDGLKVGGILCTSTYKSKKFNVSAGIGLNVDNERPTVCLNAALQRVISNGYQLQHGDIVAAFFNNFEIFFDLLVNQGFLSLQKLYYKTWLHSGQRVVVLDQMDDNDDGRLVESIVTIQGLTSSGYLLAVGEDGRTCELHPDGNSLDFFKGLVRRKLS